MNRINIDFSFIDSRTFYNFLYLRSHVITSEMHAICKATVQQRYAAQQ